MCLCLSPPCAFLYIYLYPEYILVFLPYPTLLPTNSLRRTKQTWTWYAGVVSVYATLGEQAQFLLQSSRFLYHRQTIPTDCHMLPFPVRYSFGAESLFRNTKAYCHSYQILPFISFHHILTLSSQIPFPTCKLILPYFSSIFHFLFLPVSTSDSNDSNT